MVSDDGYVIAACRNYSNELWQRGSSADLSRDMLDCWAEKVTRYRLASGRPRRARELGDFGAKAGFESPPPVLPAVFADADQAFVKFLGKSDNRERHRFLSYRRRPVSVEDCAVMFIARLTNEPDIRIFGRPP